MSVAYPTVGNIGLMGATKDYFSSETGATVAGLTGGILAGEFVGELLAETFSLTGWEGVAAKGAVKMGLSFAAFIVGRNLPVIGLARPVVYALSAGLFASWLVDVVAEAVPGSPGWAGTLGNKVASKIKGLNLSLPDFGSLGSGGSGGDRTIESRLEIFEESSPSVTEEEIQIREA